MAERKVLVIEDDEVIRDAVREFLELKGFSVETAIHGADALERLGSGEPPSLILLDLNMPVMSGKTFLEKLRAMPETCAKIPVVLMTALPDEKIPGVAGILQKPFRLKSVLERIHSIQAP